MAEPNGRAPLLDLDALTEPLGNVKIGGERYAIRQWDAMSLRERNRLAKISERMAVIEKMDEPDDLDSAEYDELAVEAMGAFTPDMDPDAARVEIGKVRTAVATFFAMRLTRQTELLMSVVGAMGPKATPEESIGANGSPGSNRVTRRARRKSG